MIELLTRLIDEVAELHSRLVLLLGGREAGKSRLLAEIGRIKRAPVMNVGSELGMRLAARPARHRPLAAPELLRELADERAGEELLLLDNIELLFDGTLRLDPLDLIKHLARSRRVVAVWPGELRDGRLVYAEMGHPEHQDYGLEGLVPFAIQ